MNNGIQPSSPAFAESVPSGRRPEPFFLRLVKLWLWLSALASLAGWCLSALGQLNRAGYALFFVAAAGVAFVCGWQPSLDRPGWRRFFRRFRRPLPGAFALLALLIFAGGVWYPPSNYTGLAYRVGRVLQWLDHGQWWWIHTQDYRMNDRACGAEWFYVPLMLFTKSDRALFLINFVPFLLLPGLIFSVFTRLGVRARVAWHWMWLLPTGYNFLLQAGSIANDAFPTVYGLAALDFVLRARTTRRVSDAWYSLVAAALLTGAKASNLPLLLPWAVLGFPLLPILKRRLAATALVLLVAAAVSFLPTAVLNVIYCGDWSGASLEPPRLSMKDPWAGIVGNAFQLVLDNLTPPVFPLAGWWNQHAPLFLPQFLVRAASHFDNGMLSLGELPTEDWAGIGFGLSLLLAASVGATFGVRRTGPLAGAAISVPLRRWVFCAAWLALLAYCVKSGLVNAARVIAPYYPLLVASLVAGAAQSEIVRRRWWQRFAGTTVALTFVVLALSPDRPLWPANTILTQWSSRHPDLRLASRAREVYSLYAQRPDALAGVRAMLPPGLKTIGLVAGVDDCDVSLWRPFGSRRVEHFLVADPPELIWSQVQYVVVGGFNLSEHHMTIDDWLQTNHAEIVATTNVMVKISEGQQFWYLTRSKP